MRALILAALLASAAAPAFAATSVTLRADVADADGQVTLGDLFDGAGAAASVPVAVRNGASIVLDAGQVRMAALRAGLDWDNARGLRRIIVRGGAAASPASAVSATTPKAGVEVLTWARSMNAGEVVQAQDLVWAKLAGAPVDAPQDSDALVGMEIRRPMRAGAAAALRDVSAPVVIKQGDTIAVTYAAGGVSLTLQAKAMGAAAVGQVFAVQNTASKKIIQAVAQGPGVAAVGPNATASRDSNLRFAAR